MTLPSLSITRTILMLSSICIAAATFGLSGTPAFSAEEEKEVNLYYNGQEHLIRPLLDAFTKETNIDVNMITGGKSKLVTRLEQEAEHTQADVLLTVDIGNIFSAQKKKLLQPVTSDILNAQIPANLRSKDGLWYGFTVRTRAIFYAKDRVKPSELSTYADLADPKWKGKLLVRSSSNVYNQSLLASIIAHEGEEKALSWAKGVVANFARNPKGGDRDQLRAVAVGEGDIAVGNSYYFGRLIHSEKDTDREAAAKIGIFFPNQDGRGAHINIRGGGVTLHAKHPKNALKLLEFFASDRAQAFFAQTNYEYPAKESIELPETLKAWGTFKRDTIPLETVGKYHVESIMTFDDASWP